MQMYLDYKLNRKIPSDLPWLLTHSTPPFVSTNFETKPAPFHWGQCLCHFMMQSSINANHSPADSFHWKPSTSSRTTIPHYLCPWTQWMLNKKQSNCTLVQKNCNEAGFFSLSKSHDPQGELWWIGAPQKGFSHLHWSRRKKLSWAISKVTRRFSQGLCMRICLHTCPASI